MKDDKNQDNLFDENTDYTKSSNERNYVYMQEDGMRFYLTKQQYAFVVKDKLKEKQRHYRMNRCLIPAKRGGLKRCPDKNTCENCIAFTSRNQIPSNFQSKNSNGILYIDAELDSNNPINKILHEEEIQSIRKAILSIPNSIDRNIIIKSFYFNKTDLEISKEIGLARSTVCERRLKTLAYLKEILKNL